jgi:hypothetical protein
VRVIFTKLFSTDVSVFLGLFECIFQMKYLCAFETGKIIFLQDIINFSQNVLFTGEYDQGKNGLFSPFFAFSFSLFSQFHFIPSALPDNLMY